MDTWPIQDVTIGVAKRQSSRFIASHNHSGRNGFHLGGHATAHPQFTGSFAAH